MSLHFYRVTHLTSHARRWWHHLVYASGTYREESFFSYDCSSLTFFRRWSIELRYNFRAMD